MNTELSHYGVKGMKWGVRRYRNKDGTLTLVGRKRASRYKTKMLKKSQEKADRANKSNQRSKAALDDLDKWGKQSDYYDEYVYETLRDAVHDYTYSTKNSAAVGKAWLSVNKTLQNTDVNTVSKKEMTQTIKKIIKEAKRENKSWTYY